MELLYFPDHSLEWFLILFWKVAVFLIYCKTNIQNVHNLKVVLYLMF